MSDNLARKLNEAVPARTISFFDLEKNETFTYPIPQTNMHCADCGAKKYDQLDADWEDGQSTKKWISFRCRGRKFVTTHFKRTGVHDGYWIRCENVTRMFIDESTRLVEEEV